MRVCNNGDTTFAYNGQKANSSEKILCTKNDLVCRFDCMGDM